MCVEVWKNEERVIPIHTTTAKKAIETASHANAIFVGGRDWKSALATNVGGSTMKAMKRENQEEFCSRSPTDKITNSKMLNRNETKTETSMRGIVLTRVSPPKCFQCLQMRPAMLISFPDRYERTAGSLSIA
jgi:hypothetical protein